MDQNVKYEEAREETKKCSIFSLNFHSILPLNDGSRSLLKIMHEAWIKTRKHDLAPDNHDISLSLSLSLCVSHIQFKTRQANWKHNILHSPLSLSVLLNVMNAKHMMDGYRSIHVFCSAASITAVKKIIIIKKLGLTKPHRDEGKEPSCVCVCVYTIAWNVDTAWQPCCTCGVCFGCGPFVCVSGSVMLTAFQTSWAYYSPATVATCQLPPHALSHRLSLSLSPSFSLSMWADEWSLGDEVTVELLSLSFSHEEFQRCFIEPEM